MSQTVSRDGGTPSGVVARAAPPVQISSRARVRVRRALIVNLLMVCAEGFQFRVYQDGPAEGILSREDLCLLSREEEGAKVPASFPASSSSPSRTPSSSRSMPMRAPEPGGAQV